MYVPFPTPLTLSFSSVSTLALVLTFSLFCFPLIFGSTVFLLYPPLLFSRFPFLIEKMIAFTLQEDPGQGSTLLSSSQKGPCPAGETLPSFSAVESAVNTQPALPGRKPRKRGDPSRFQILICKKHSRKWSVDF